MSYFAETIERLLARGIITPVAIGALVCIIFGGILAVTRQPQIARRVVCLGVVLAFAPIAIQSLWWFSIPRSPIEGNAEGWMLIQAMGFFLLEMDVVLLSLSVNALAFGVFSAIDCKFQAFPISVRVKVVAAICSVGLCIFSELIRYRIRVLVAL